jgi:hypothetical protein
MANCATRDAFWRALARVEAPLEAWRHRRWLRKTERAILLEIRDIDRDIVSGRLDQDEIAEAMDERVELYGIVGRDGGIA